MNEQYQYMHDWKDAEGRQELGVVASSTWIKDPRRLLFSLSRYKFVAKMLDEKENVIEAGCGDGWCSKLVASTVKNLMLSDYDKRFVDEAIEVNCMVQNIKCIQHDFTNGYIKGDFDAFYCLDVLEHVSKQDESKFIHNAVRSCVQDAIFIFGMPSLESQAILPYERRDPGHINCKSKNEFKQTMKCYFKNVLMFSMNDEVIHTGHDAMSHYIIAVCVSPYQH